MKLVTYSRNQSVSCGILADDRIIDIPALWPGPNPPRTVIQILKKGPAGLEKLRRLAESPDVATPLDAVKLLAPIPRPPKIIALAGNYAKHDQIPWPPYSETIDYEIELAVVIGKNAKCVGTRDASDYIAGYTIANDISARTVTFKRNRLERPWDDFYDWLNGKWADGFCPMGPCLLTADEVRDVHNLNLTLKVNDSVRQNANTEQMIYTVPDIVSFLSHLMTLEPGDIIATGTPAGVALATGDFLQPGDRIDATIEKLGTLTNTLGQRPEEFYVPLTPH
jgi:2-keto-4-pentenoate hydratase/2-oxohepta-3-ene-1,7-dioic acid hydratase in catechol pathway